MSRRTRGTVLSSLALVTALVAGACGGGGSPSSKDTVWASADPHKASGKVVAWAWGDNQEIADGIAARFMKVYPNIEMKFQVVALPEYVKKLSAALASGEGPDVYNLGIEMIPQFGPLSEDLTPLYESVLGKDWESKMIPAMVEEGTYKGRRVGAPGNITGAGTVIVNQGLLKSLGLTWPAGITSIDDLAGFCAQVRAKGKGCLGIGAKDEWVSQDVLQALANSVKPGVFREAVEGKTPWTDPALVKAFDLWQQLFDKRIVQDGALAMAMYPDTDQAFQQGKYVASAMGTWIAQNFTVENSITYQKGAGVKNPKPLQTTVERFPGIGGKPVDVFASAAWGTAINASGKNKAAAAAWVNWYALDTQGEPKRAADTLVGPASIHGVKAEPKGLAYPDLVAPSIAYLSEQMADVKEVRAVTYPKLITALGLALQQSASGTGSKSVTQQLQAASAAVDRT
ncbi:ABC transporter substrate-binding protein [Actinomadura viridis]|uniref:ABC transporter substrate-binding protein n=1 Tax=Actinomadura viridis TaxID=58110 RepID=UPI00368C317C